VDAKTLNSVQSYWLPANNKKIVSRPSKSREKNNLNIYEHIKTSLGGKVPRGFYAT